MSKNKTPLFRILKNKYSVYRRLYSAGERTLPDFLIIGTAKGGTTSLFNYLTKHPQVIAPFKKEIHFFDCHFNKGLNWYKLHFPKKSELNTGSHRKITGEATPYYLSHPLAPERVKNIIPKARIIILLRNPIYRAYSNYNHMVRMGFEKESFENAIEMEAERTKGEFEKMIKDPQYYSFKHHHFSYLSRSIYFDEVSRWFIAFGKEHIEILNSEELYADPEKIFKRTIEYLQLETWKPESFNKFNDGGGYEKLSDTTIIKLKDFFKPHNEKLFKLIGQKYDW